MKRIHTIAAAALSCALAACSSPTQSGPTPQIRFEMKVTVPAGGEIHDCQFVKVPAGVQYVVGGEHMYTTGSHHLLLFRTDLTAIPAGGDQIQDCYEGGGGTIMSHARGVLYGSQVPQGSMSLPSGVGLKLASEEVLLFQVHYINATAGALDARVDVGLFTTADATKIQNLAGELFFYNPFIDVLPSSLGKAAARCTLAKDLTLVTVSPHFHARGQSYQAFLDLPAQPPSAAPFYTSTDWEHPAAWTGGPLQIAAGSAVRWVCNYDNTTGAKEYFQGQSAVDNEMCMFTGLYYPAMDQPSELCLNAMDQFGVGTKACGDTASCLYACPPGSAPTGLGSASATGDVSPCWQKCITASCPAASTPLLGQLRCIGTKCATECGGGGASNACTTCALTNCSNELNACQNATCN